MCTSPSETASADSQEARRAKARPEAGACARLIVRDVLRGVADRQDGALLSRIASRIELDLPPHTRVSAQTLRVQTLSDVNEH